jgi:hypothetical protein
MRSPIDVTCALHAIDSDVTVRISWGSGFLGFGFLQGFGYLVRLLYRYLFIH